MLTIIDRLTLYGPVVSCVYRVCIRDTPTRRLVSSSMNVRIPDCISSGDNGAFNGNTYRCKRQRQGPPIGYSHKDPNDRLYGNGLASVCLDYLSRFAHSRTLLIIACISMERSMFTHTHAQDRRILSKDMPFYRYVHWVRRSKRSD